MPLDPAQLAAKLAAITDIDQLTDETEIEEWEKIQKRKVEERVEALRRAKKADDKRLALAEKLRRAPAEIERIQIELSDKREEIDDHGIKPRGNGAPATAWETKRNALDDEVEKLEHERRYWTSLITDAAAAAEATSKANTAINTGIATPSAVQGGMWTPGQPGEFAAAIAASMTMAIKEAAKDRKRELKLSDKAEIYEHGKTDVFKWLPIAEREWNKAGGPQLTEKSDKQYLLSLLLDPGMARRVVTNNDISGFQEFGRALLAVFFQCESESVDERVHSRVCNHTMHPAQEAATYNEELRRMLRWTSYKLSNERYLELLPRELRKMMPETRRMSIDEVMDATERKSALIGETAAEWQPKRARTDQNVPLPVVPNAQSWKPLLPASILDQTCVTHPTPRFEGGRTHTNRACNRPNDAHKKLLRDNGVPEECGRCKELNKTHKEVMFRHFEQVCNHSHQKQSGKPINLKYGGFSMDYYPTADSSSEMDDYGNTTNAEEKSEQPVTAEAKERGPFNPFGTFLGIIIQAVHPPFDGRLIDEKVVAQEDYAASQQNSSPQNSDSMVYPHFSSEPVEDLIQRLERQSLNPGLRIGNHVRTRILVDGKDQWALCDTGAQLTILNNTWAAEHGIKKVAKARLRVVGFDNVPQTRSYNISEPITFRNFN
ncbi:hypothetical protein HDU99_008674, partial [Rhizoclosmatium hyalinum]